jgi:trigger factor
MLQCDEIEYCKIKAHYIADSDLVDEKIEEAVRNIMKSGVAVPGFRKGRAKYEHYKSHFRKNIKGMVKRELIAHAYDDVVFETRMKPLGYPQVLSAELDGLNFWCDLLFLKKPDFEVTGYKDLEIPKPHIEKSSSNMEEEMLQELRTHYGDVVPYGENDFIQEGDQVTMDVLCEMGGEKVDEFSSEGFFHVVGNSSIPNFDDNIMGMSVDEERSFDVTLDSKFTDEFAGKTVKLTIKLHMGTKKTLCALDDDLAKRAGHDDFKKLRTAVSGAVSQKMQALQTSEISQQVISRLLENNDFEVPVWLTLTESQQAVGREGKVWDDLDDNQREAINEVSKKKVKLSLILDSIRDVEPDVVYTDEELVMHLRQRLLDEGRNADQILSSAQVDGTLIGMIASLKDEATMQWVRDNAKIVE